MKVKEILGLVPEELLKQIGEETGVDKHVKKLNGRSIFNLFLYSFIEEDRISLRQMEQIFNSMAFEYYNGKVEKSKHTSLSDRLRTIKSEYFERTFEELVKKFEQVFDATTKDKIVRFDSSIITLSSKLLKVGIPVTQGPKNQIKFSIGYSNLIPKKLKIQTDKSHRSEDVSLKEIIKAYGIKVDEIAVFDRGLQSRQSFCEFDQEGLQFVSRLGDKARYKTIKNNEQFNSCDHGNLRIEEDLVVNLQAYRAKSINHPFRLIIASKIADPEGQKLYFVSNIYNLKATEIVEIYKKRWEIEVFFKFIKQHLNAKHFLSRNLNGIKVTLYMILILAILLTVYKVKNNLKGYMFVKKRFKEELRVLLTRNVVNFFDGDLGKYDQFTTKMLS